MANEKFSLKVLSENGVIYFGECQLLFIPGLKDVVAIMAHHTPMVMKLGPGKIIAQDGQTKRELATVKKGVAYVAEDEVSVLVDL